MQVFRYWSSPYQVGNEWNYDAELIPSRLALGYPKLKLETNSLGFRFDEHDLNLEQEVIITLGGSTTFGHYCSKADAWPSKLQSKSKLRILNLGQPKADIWQSFVVLLDFIRTYPKLKIKMVITYDGINQNTAYGHFMRDSKAYQLEHINYRLINRDLQWFKEISSRSYNLANIGFFLFGKKYKKYWEKKTKQNRLPLSQKLDSQMDTLVAAESQYFLSTLNILKEFCQNVLDTKFYHFLEPTLFDVLPDTLEKDENEDYNLRRKYYSKLYDQISCAYPHRLNLRKIYELSSRDFIDFAHLTPVGYTIIANNIWEVISDCSEE